MIGIVGCTNTIKLEHDASDEYYTELYRPQYHFSTPVGNLADPNGLIYFKGEYHLFHQKNGHWAHAISKDLIHWSHQPIALDHDDLGQALSGSAVVDWNDTTGFFNGKAGLVAIYTNTAGGEAQSIAFSSDRGRTWERYEGNPVIKNPGIKDFRDPKVFWHDETEKWVMVVSTDKSVTFFNSDNLIEWEYLSRFGDGQGLQVAVWECPDLFRLPVNGEDGNEKWVLHVSVGDNNETNGSTAQYFIGEFDGKEFINEYPADHILITDYGQDFYAAQSFSDIPVKDGRKIWLAWMANWRYPYQSPTDPWKGAMSIPRELSLRTVEDGKIRLFQEPISEIESLRATEYSINNFHLEGNHRIDDFSGTTFEFEATITWEDVEEFGIRVRQADDEETVIGINTKTEKVFVDRTNSGLQRLIDRNGSFFDFGSLYETDYPTKQKNIKLRGFVDESSVELFVNDGEIVFTNLIYTKPTNNGIELYTKGGSIDIESLNFYHLHSTWRNQPPNNKISQIVVNEERVHITIDEEEKLQAQVKPDWLRIKGEDLVWSVEDPEIIELSLDGMNATIRGKKEGTTQVIITDLNNLVEKSISVRVSGK
ncbi:levanase [Anaerobacillus alkalidiazotrophicus]|uniref:Levanase n=2 Tax=Anaerobacillus alkalidiazotrophicus TaxID=472963 RepID=A0A1S2MCE7_9BACI|nr:levanase [Anaerobacillus alkalidiazotrophicus]